MTGFHLKCNTGLKWDSLTLSWRRPLTYRNQSIDLWTCFYMITASIMKGLRSACTNTSSTHQQNNSQQRFHIQWFRYKWNLLGICWWEIKKPGGVTEICSSSLPFQKKVLRNQCFQLKSVSLYQQSPYKLKLDTEAINRRCLVRRVF